jgi:hypothetical protein
MREDTQGEWEGDRERCPVDTQGRLQGQDGEACGSLRCHSPFFIPPTCRVGTRIVTYTTITEHTPLMEAGYGGATLYLRAGTNLWGEFWWIEGEHRWVFFDDEKTSETYAEDLTHCPKCGRSLERKALRATTPSLLP